jgi:hypothetical protein
MSKEAANKFVHTIVWGTHPDWYKQLEEKGYTTEELVRAAAPLLTPRYHNRASSK